MARKRRAILVSLAAIVLGIALYAAWSHHRAETARKLREVGYAARLADYARDIKPGMPRSDVEGMLKTRRISFFQRTYDTLIPLEREPSGVWYCGPVLVSVKVSYESGGDSKFEAYPAYSVRAVTLDYWADDCL
jgi:hypothetical protein